MRAVLYRCPNVAWPDLDYEQQIRDLPITLDKLL